MTVAVSLSAALPNFILKNKRNFLIQQEQKPTAKLASDFAIGKT